MKPTEAQINIVLPGSIRSKKNSKRPIKAGKKFMLIPSKAYMKWEEKVRKEIIGKTSLFIGPLHVEAHIYYKGRRPDLSGALESIGDCLEGIVWENDAQIESWDGSRLYHDKKNPRTEVIIRPMAEEEAWLLFERKGG